MSDIMRNPAAQPNKQSHLKGPVSLNKVAILFFQFFDCLDPRLNWHFFFIVSVCLNLSNFNFLTEQDHRKKELMRITHENQAILKRIQRAQPMYNHVKWEESHKRNQEYLRNCCEYPLVLRKPLGSGMGGDMMGGMDSLSGDPAGITKLDDYAATGQELKYVLKEGDGIFSCLGYRYFDHYIT